MMVLQVSELSKEYQGRPVLTGCTFHLSGGERVGLVGANGCGKSTLLQILAGALPADGGSVSWVTAGLTRAYLPQSRDGEESTLSGGQKTRAAVARILERKPDVLLLDEPTNHLDAEGLAWLESALTGYRGTVLVVSHDRFFLDRVASRIVELENGCAKSYPGNYSAYASQKQAELERAQEEYRQYVNEKKHLLEAIRRQAQWAEMAHQKKLPPELVTAKAWQKSKAKAHAQVAKSMAKRLERIKVEKPREAGQIHIRMDEGGGGARNLILAERLGFTYGGATWIFRGASFFVQRGDRVAVVGPNGSGKTTLVKLILGQLAPTEGKLYCTPARVAYLAQELENLHPGNTVLQEATGNSALDQAAARSLLGCLLFSGEAIFKPVAVLSGGEKVRLALAKILLSAPDLLVLDEPTNGLDLPSRERVEEALDGYPGTLLLVSHDRYLLKKLATRILAVEGGRIRSFQGTYAEFLQPPAPPSDDQRLLLETRLAHLAAQLAAPPPGEKERLEQEFLVLSRELRSLRA